MRCLLSKRADGSDNFRRRSKISKFKSITAHCNNELLKTSLPESRRTQQSFK